MSTIGGTTVQADANGSAFVAELTATGTANWVSLVNGSGGIVFGADTNSAGRTFAAGRINSTTNEAYLAAVGPDPALTTPLRAASGDNTNGAVSAAADHHGGVWVGGEFLGTIDLGTPPLSGSDPTQPSNFLVHLEP
jgi:hypothetical protein